MFPLCFPRADDPPPPRKPFRSRVVDASSFLSRAAAFRGGGVRWRVSPGGGVGCAIGCRSEKKRMSLVRKTSFCFFLQKKNHKKKGQKRDILRPKRRLFNTEHQSATHHEPKNHHRAETGTDDDVPNAHHRTRRGFFRKPLSRRGTTSDDPRRRLAPFFCRGNFPISDWKSRQVEKRRTAWRKEKRWPEKQSRVDSRRCASFPRFFAIRRRLASKRTIAGAAHPTAAGLF